MKRCYLEITPLPDDHAYVHGCYGIETAYVRGLIHIKLNENRHHKAMVIHVRSLKLSLKADTKVTFVSLDNGYELVERETVWWEDELQLLGNPIRMDEFDIAESFKSDLCIPFEFVLPENIDKLHPIIPPSCRIEHNSYGSSSYSATTSASLNLNLEEIVKREDEPISIINFLSDYPKSIEHEHIVLIDPFVVFYPTLIPKLFHPDIKQWRSQIDAYPCEYDFHLSNSVVSPGEDLVLSYRIAVSNKAKQYGIRIHSLRFIFKENQSVGDSYRGTVATGNQEIGRWEQIEHVIPFPHSNENSIENNSKNQAQEDEFIELKEFGTPQRNSDLPIMSNDYFFHSFSDLSTTTTSPASSFIFSPPFTNPYTHSHYNHMLRRASSQKELGFVVRSTAFRGGGTADGIYAESEGTIRVPSDYLSKFNATTPKTCDLSSLSSRHQYQPLAFVQIRHVVRVDIEFRDHERKSFECNVTVLPTPLNSLKTVLEISPEIIPCPEYDRVVGGDIWIPTYEP